VCNILDLFFVFLLAFFAAFPLGRSTFHFFGGRGEGAILPEARKTSSKNPPAKMVRQDTAGRIKMERMD
jgi:hypothetical protein